MPNLFIVDIKGDGTLFDTKKIKRLLAYYSNGIDVAVVSVVAGVGNKFAGLFR